MAEPLLAERCRYCALYEAILCGDIETITEILVVSDRGPLIHKEVRANARP